MSDELSSPRWRRAALQSFLIVVLCAVLGVVAGFLWHQLWTPATGIVWQHQWQKGLIWLHPKTMAQGWSENAYQDVFSATAIFVLLTGAAGLLTGLVSAFLLAAEELVTLGSVIVGGLLGAVIARVIGFQLSAADPNAVAKTAAEGTVLPDRIHLDGFGVFAVYPGAALLVLAVVFFVAERRSAAHVEPAEVSVPSEPSTLG